MALTVDVHAHAGGFRLDVAFEAAGGTTAVLGASGAGKTLTLRTLAGLLRPDSGQIALDGRVLYDARAGVDVAVRRRNVGYVFQTYALFPYLSVAENVGFGLRGRPRQEIDGRVSELVALLALQGLEGRRPAQLSGGQQQRVALGRALAPGPSLLLLDEPFSALDAPTRAALAEDFLALQAAVDVPAVLVTHDVAEAYALAEHLVVLGAGSVLQHGPKAAVFHHPATPEVASLLGVRNLLPGIVVGSRDGTAILDVGGLAVAAESTLRLGEGAVVGLREHHIRATPADALGNATLVREVDRGIARSLVLRLDGGAEIRAAAPVGGSAATTGSRWDVTVSAAAAHAWPAL